MPAQRKRLGVFQSLVTIYYKKPLEEVEAQDALRAALNTLPPDLGYSIVKIKRPEPPLAFAQLASHISKTHPFRRGWDAALAAKPRSSAPFYRSQESYETWLAGWDLAMAHWTVIERKRYNASKAH